MFGFSSLNLARLSDKQLWPRDSFLKGLLALSLHPWKNCEKIKYVVGDMGLFSRTKLYAQGIHRKVLSNYWCLECEIIKLLQWKHLFVLEKCIWGQNHFYFNCLPQQPNPCGFFVGLWDAPHVAGLVLGAPPWAGQSRPAHTEPCLLFLWERLPTPPRGVLPHSRCSRHELPALLSLGFACSGKAHFTDFFCKCCFSFSSVSMVCSSLCFQQK